MTAVKKHVRCGWCPRKIARDQFERHVENMHGERLQRGEVCNARELEPPEARVRPRKDTPGQSFMFEVPKEALED